MLNNCLRRDSHHLWSYHLAMMYIDGFSPMVPLHFDAHKSQTDKQLKAAHFASRLLNFCTIRKELSADDVCELFLFFISSKINPRNFRDVITVVNSQTGSNYLSFLVQIAVYIEEKVERLGNCFVYQQLQLSSNESWPLKIMKDGLKERLTAENKKVVKKFSA